MASGHVTCLVQVLKCSLCQCARRMMVMVHGLIIFSSFVFETSTVGIVGRYSSRTKRRLALQRGFKQVYGMQGPHVLGIVNLLPLHPADLERHALPPKDGLKDDEDCRADDGEGCADAYCVTMMAMATRTSDGPMLTMVTMLTLLTMTTRMTVMMSPMPGGIQTVHDGMGCQDANVWPLEVVFMHPKFRCFVNA